MKKRHYIMLCCIVLLPGFTYRNYNPDEPLKNITAGEMKRLITFLASDELKGRATPSPGLDSAAAYIAGEFKKSGVLPFNGSYLQKIDFGITNLSPNNLFRIYKGDSKTELKLKDDFIPFLISGSSDYKGQIVFAGYGITAPEFSYDDYKGIDVQGKIVVVLKHNPGELADNSPFKANDRHLYFSNDYKVKNAKSHGAVGIIIVNDPLNHLSIKPVGFSWPIMGGKNTADGSRRTIRNYEKEEIAAVDAGETFVNCIFGSVDKLKEIQSSIDSKYQPASFEITNTLIELKIDMAFEPSPFSNVVGYVEGSDPKLKDECVIIGAHYDHKGLAPSYIPGKDRIYNGADDNASGTAAVIAAAKEFASLNKKPKRSVVFVLFGAEEIGGWGSKGYTYNPPIPIEKSVAMLCLDMISRNNRDSLSVGISTKTPDLIEINKLSNKKVGFKIAPYFADFVPGGSDHQSFQALGVPVMYFFADTHKDYHQVTDEVQLIDAEKAARTARLVYYDALSIANDNKYYKKNK